jgi:hypothetical protein
VFISGLATAQTSAPNTASDPSKLADELKQLQQVVAEQQKTMTQQQKQLADQQTELQKLRQKSTDSSGASSEPRLVGASLTAPASATKAAARPVSNTSSQDTERKESPLSFRIGGAEFTPGGFMDFTSIFRTTNTGNLGTNFFAIPYSNTVAGHLTETRFTAQNSRLSLKANEKFGKNDVTGYVEMDFLGNDSSTVFVTSNSHTLRERLYFVDLKRDKFELTAGQMWGFLTPNRTGLSPYTSDVFYGMNMDFNYQVGLTWTRQPGVRFLYHPNDNWAMGVSVENPEQFGGQGEITYPSSFNAQVAGQIDQANISSTPNLHPDVIPKIAYDTTKGGKHYHAEIAGLLSGFKITSLPTQNLAGTATTFGSHVKEGGGLSAAVNLEVLRNVHFVANAFWSDGGGRYIAGMAPDLIVKPVDAPGTTCTIVVSGVSKTPMGCDAAISLVHSGSAIAGVEYQVTPRTMVYGYYGGMYARRNFVTDITSTAATQPFIGFGGPNSANNDNRAIQEPSLGWIQTFWKNPQYGALQLITQASYVTRSPWFVSAGAPKNAHLVQGWVDLRYVLP